MYLFLYDYTSVTCKVLSIWFNTPVETFSHCSKQFLNLLILMPFSVSAVFLLLFVSPRPHRLNTSLWGLFPSGETTTGKKVTLGRIRWIGWWSTGVMLLLVKNCWTLSTVWADALPWNGQTHWKSLPKKSLKPNAASHNDSC